MAEVLPNDIGLATFNDVGDVANLQTNAKEIVSAINEILASAGSSFGEQVLVEGEDNVVIGSGNIIYGSRNRVFGSDNVVIGDNHLVIGSNKIITEGMGDLFFDRVDASSKKIYFYIFSENNLNFHIQTGDRVAVEIEQSWCTPDRQAWISIKSGVFLTTVTEVNMDNSYIAIADMPISDSPPDDVYTVLDYTSVPCFSVLREEYKKNGNGSVTMGGSSSGLSSLSANIANASGDYSAAFNTANSKGYCAFAVNLGNADGTRAFAANEGNTYMHYSSALNSAFAYGGYSSALNYARTCGRAIKCVSMNGYDGSVTAAEGENLSALVGARLLVRYNNPYNTIIYNIKTVSSVNGQVIYFTENFGGAYNLMPDGYIFRVESNYASNFATGYGVTGNKYSQAHGLYTLCTHEGSVICGRYGISSENYSWSLANGTSFSDMALAVKILQNGDIHADGTISSPCADYSEMFEWEDKNPNCEDRAGYFVKLVGDKITFTEEFDTPLGVVSAIPAIVGDSGEMHWQGKYVTDDFGRIQYHDVLISAVTDKDGNVLEEEHYERQPVLNPDWDSSQEYIPRLKRPEWTTVGVIGKLVVYDDGTLKPGDLCRCGNGGIAIKSINNGFQVLKRISEDKVLVWFR